MRKKKRKNLHGTVYKVIKPINSDPEKAQIHIEEAAGGCSSRPCSDIGQSHHQFSSNCSMDTETLAQYKNALRALHRP